MDAFFASVEQLDNPALAGKPVIIGGGQRGVVATASYEARKFGVHSAMPIATARKLCPQGIFIRPNGRRYSEVSSNIMAALHVFSPVVQPASIDEAYLDITRVCEIFGSARSAGMAIKDCIANLTGGLTCSVGMAPVKFLAKICSDINKPDGIFIIEQQEVDDFLIPLPVVKLPGVGKSMAQSLQKFGIVQVGQLRSLSREFLGQKFGKWGLRLHDRAFGIDPACVHENAPPKSESAERTFEKDTLDRTLLAEALQAHAEKVSARLMRHGLAGRTITLKIKFADFRQITRSRTFASQFSDSGPIFSAARNLLWEEPLPLPVRLIGLGVSSFDARPFQFCLPGLENSLAKGAKFSTFGPAGPGQA